MIYACQAHGLLDRGRWAAYAAGTVGPWRIEFGEGPVGQWGTAAAAVSGTAGPGGGAGSGVVCNGRDVRIDGVPVADLWVPWATLGTVAAGQWATADLIGTPPEGERHDLWVNPAVTGRLAVGRHRVTAEVRLSVGNSNGVGGDPARASPLAVMNQTASGELVIW